MRILAILVAISAVGAGAVSAQEKPLQTPPPTTTAAPPKPQPKPQPKTQPASRPAMTIAVTNRTGSPLPNVSVVAVGPVERSGTTDGEGVIVFRNMNPGTYRLRFEHDEFVTLEREVTVLSGRPLKTDAALTPAPPPPAPPTPVAPAPEPEPVKPKTSTSAASSVSIPDFVEKNYIGNAPFKQSPLMCTDTLTAQLLQLRDPVTEHAHPETDELLYVVAGEGTQQIAGQSVALSAGVFALVPRGVSHTLTRRGSRPLVVLSVLSGAPCEPGR